MTQRPGRGLEKERMQPADHSQVHWEVPLQKTGAWQRSAPVGQSGGKPFQFTSEEHASALSLALVCLHIQLQKEKTAIREKMVRRTPETGRVLKTFRW